MHGVSLGKKDDCRSVRTVDSLLYGCINVGRTDSFIRGQSERSIVVHVIVYHISAFSKHGTVSIMRMLDLDTRFLHGWPVLSV